MDSSTDGRATARSSRTVVRLLTAQAGIKPSLSFTSLCFNYYREFEMNASTHIETAALVSAQRVTTQDVCNVIRAWSMPSHDDLTMVVANLATKVQTPNALSAVATAVLVDMLDDVVGQIEQDKVDQQAEQMWIDSKRHDAPKWSDLPGFKNVRGELDALTVRRVV